MRRRPDLVLLGDRIWYAPDGVDDVQCVARTRRGTRCRNALEYGQVASWTRLRSTQGVITVYDLGGHDAATSQRWLAQHCITHDGPDTVDAEAPGWEPFDPAVHHAALVTSLDDLIAEYTQRMRAGVTDQWQPWHPLPP